MHNNTPSSPQLYWDFKHWKEHRWFLFLFVFLGGIIALYMFSHILLDDKIKSSCIHGLGYEYERLNTEQMEHIHRICGYPASVVVQQKDTSVVVVTNTSMVATAPIQMVDAHKAGRIISYIQLEFSNKADSCQLDTIKRYISDTNVDEVTSFLRRNRFRVKSYFWLTGPEVYFEIVFWSLFGVICSLLFNISNISKSSTTNPDDQRTVFDPTEIPSQLAKLFYAPICTLVIILGYNFFENDSVADISSSKGIVVFTFLAGFYSSRMMSFLDRLKDVILPSSGTTTAPSLKRSPSNIKDLTISLALDESMLTAAERAEVAEIGLGSAIVTLESEKGGEPITALKHGEDQDGMYIVAEIAPGTYEVKAQWSQEVGGAVINLYGTCKADVQSSDSVFTVQLKKEASEG